MIHALSLSDLPRRHRETGKGIVSICSAHPLARPRCTPPPSAMARC